MPHNKFLISSDQFNSGECIIMSVDFVLNTVNACGFYPLTRLHSRQTYYPGEMRAQNIKNKKIIIYCLWNKNTEKKTVANSLFGSLLLLTTPDYGIHAEMKLQPSDVLACQSQHDNGSTAL